MLAYGSAVGDDRDWQGTPTRTGPAGIRAVIGDENSWDRRIVR